MAKKTVLVIDDDVDLIEIMRVTLENAGFDVLDARNGRDGLTMAHERRPDLILLDVMMDSVDEGIHVAHQLRESNRTNHIPILMLTAVADKTGFEVDPQRDAGVLPVNEYLEKPVSPRRLIDLVRKHLKLD